MMHALMANLALSYNTDVKHSTISLKLKLGGSAAERKKVMNSWVTKGVGLFNRSSITHLIFEEVTQMFFFFYMTGCHALEV